MRDEGLATRNFEALKNNYPEYAGVLSAAPETSAYTFEVAGDAVLCRDATGRWLHGPEDPAVTARREAERVVREGAELYIVVRPGLGHQALAILDAVENHAPRSLVLVVEDRFDLLRAAMGLVDWEPVLRSPAAVLLLGSPDVVVEAFLERHPKLALLPAALVAGAGAEWRPLTARLMAHSDGVRKGAEEELAAADIRINQRRGRREPLRVIMADREFGYLSAPIADGFRASGCSVEVVPSERRTPRNVRAHEWFWQMWPRAPDLVLWMNRPELSPFGIEALRTLQIPSVLWTVDSPVRMQLTQNEFAAVDLHLCFDAEYLPACALMGAHRSAQLSLAAGIAPLDGCAPDDAMWPLREGPDVTFVGSLGEQRISELREFIRHHDPRKLAFLDQLASGSEDPAPAFEQETGKRYRGLPCLYIDETRLARRRIDVLSRMPPASLTIFGGADWAGTRSPLAASYAGRSVGYGADLSYIYYHSLINVNVFHAQCLDSTNSRVYDVLAAGGFLLTEDRPVLHREFEAGRHFVTFSSPEEAGEKAAYYLAHPGEREEIAREGQRHVLAQHTFTERCRRLIELARPFMGPSRSLPHS